MKKFKIEHKTHYAFSNAVQLLPHTLRLRPREGHELRIEYSKLEISPPASLRWQRDVEGNSVATATFTTKTPTLTIVSEVVIQQYDLLPHDFVVADYAVNYPFNYSDEDRVLLSPYLLNSNHADSPVITNWLGKLLGFNEKIQTFSLLLRLNQSIYQAIAYRIREEEGVQAAEQTLALGTGSCRDSASLFMAGARKLGFAARFVSGYIHSHSAMQLAGSTHAWAEVFIPGAGWKGFDPTIGSMVGADHIAVAVARLPESVPPVAGNFFGNPGSKMEVNVWVTEVK
ncbi:MAG TPA: transglutaminase family protein [Marinagarivorans sp.]